jgi:sugar/nucleoside kinase (ribokinase family)
MSDPKGILGAGNWIVDHIKVIDAWPNQDTLANIRTEFRGTGGAPCNVLIDLAKLGADFPLTGAGIVGQDEPGDWILKTCQKFGVNTGLIRRTDQQPTSYTDVMTVERTGRRTFFHQRGANMLLDADSIRVDSSNAKIFHLGYLLLLDRLDEPCARFGTRAAELLAKASELGFITCVDVVSEASDRFGRVVSPALPFLDIIFLNEFEAAGVFSLEIRRGGKIDVPTLLKTAETLLTAGVRRTTAGASFSPASWCLRTRLQGQPARATHWQPGFYSGTTTNCQWKIVWSSGFVLLPHRSVIRLRLRVWNTSTPAWRSGINSAIASRSFDIP